MAPSSAAGVLDAAAQVIGKFLAFEQPHQLQAEVYCKSDAASRGDVSVRDDALAGVLSAAELVLPARVAGCEPPVQQLQPAQYARRGADGCHAPALGGKAIHKRAEPLVRGKVVCAGDASGQKKHVARLKVRSLEGRVRDNAHAVR